MSQFRTMLGDQFIDVEADSEEHAIKKATAMLIEDLKAGRVGLMAWETGESSPPEERKIPLARRRD